MRGSGTLLLQPFRLTFISPTTPRASIPATFESPPVAEEQAVKVMQMLLWSSALIISALPSVAQGMMLTGYLVTLFRA